MDNIDAFNIAAIEIMHRCLEKFPVPAKLDDQEISKVVAGFFAEAETKDEEKSNNLKYWEICHYTIVWLTNERYIEIREGELGSGTQATLTLTGLNTLDAIPTSINEKITFKDLFYKGVNSVPAASVGAVMSQFFKLGS